MWPHTGPSGRPGVASLPILASRSSRKRGPRRNRERPAPARASRCREARPPWIRASLRPVSAPPRQILLPTLAFLGLLGLALGRAHVQAQTPEGELYAALMEYLGDVRAGDTAGASALVDGIQPDALETHVQALRSLLGQVERLAVPEDGRGGRPWSPGSTRGAGDATGSSWTGPGPPREAGGWSGSRSRGRCAVAIRSSRRCQEGPNWRLRMRPVLLATLLLSLLPTLATADILELDDGRLVEGVVVQATARSTTSRAASGRRRSRPAASRPVRRRALDRRADPRAPRLARPRRHREPGPARPVAPRGRAGGRGPRHGRGRPGAGSRERRGARGPGPASGTRASGARPTRRSGPRASRSTGIAWYTPQEWANQADTAREPRPWSASVGQPRRRASPDEVNRAVRLMMSPDQQRPSSGAASAARRHGPGVRRSRAWPSWPATSTPTSRSWTRSAAAAAWPWGPVAGATGAASCWASSAPR